MKFRVFTSFSRGNQLYFTIVNEQVLHTVISLILLKHVRIDIYYSEMCKTIELCNFYRAQTLIKP